MNSEKLAELAMESAKKDALSRVEPGQGQDGDTRQLHNTTEPTQLQGNHAGGPSQPAAVQRKRILAWLRRYGTMTTLEARNELSIMHPGGRVMELRREGHSIVTIRLETRVAKYVLLGEADHGGD